MQDEGSVIERRCSHCIVAFARKRKVLPWRNAVLLFFSEKISICGKKSYFYINVRSLVHNNSEQPTDGGWTQRRTKNMRATGIVRRIDDLGRVVIPKEIRRTLRIREGDPSQIILSEYERFGFAMLRLEERWLGR